jgi:hypothetical protein
MMGLAGQHFSLYISGGCSGLATREAYTTSDCTGPATTPSEAFPGFNKCTPLKDHHDILSRSETIACTDHGGGVGGGGGAKTTGTIIGVSFAAIAAVAIVVSVRRHSAANSKKRLADPLLSIPACASCGVTYLSAEAVFCHACSAPR